MYATEKALYRHSSGVTEEYQENVEITCKSIKTRYWHLLITSMVVIVKPICCFKHADGLHYLPIMR